MFDRRLFLDSLSNNNKPTVTDAEGSIWAWYEDLRLYEQVNTGVRLTEQQFNVRNIEIIGYYDGGGPKIVVNFNTNSDGIFGRTGPSGPSQTLRAYTIITQESSEFGVSADRLLVQQSTDGIITLREGAGLGTELAPAPDFIGFYVEGPTAGWFIGRNSHTNGNTYDFVRSSNNETDFPVKGVTLDKPTAVAFYKSDPGDPTTWSSYTV